MPNKPSTIAIIGSGTIGLSFAALHLFSSEAVTVRIFDVRPDLQDYVKHHMPGYLVDHDAAECMKRLTFASSVQEAVQDADIVQEQAPDQAELKIATWKEIERHAPKHALFWSSTSGIPASEQSRDMQDQSRLLVVHPFNPPHIMPLLEICPAASTSQLVVDRTLQYWRGIGRAPVVIRQECPGFVANRLAFALLREACSLVTQGIVSVDELDVIVQTSMGPRWSIAGPFKSYHAGGGDGGLRAFLNKLGGTIQNVWEVSETDIRDGDIKIGSSWQEVICSQAEAAYGEVDNAERDVKTKKLLAAIS